MSEPDQQSPMVNQGSYTIIFMVVLSFICALILSILASALQVPQETAKELDRSKQMLIAARIFNPFGYFQIAQGKETIPAKVVEGGRLVPSEQIVYPTDDEILSVYKARISPFLVNENGEQTTFEQAGINEQEYLNAYRKTGYYHQPWKLIYKIFANPEEGQASNENSENRPLEGYVIPVNGMGLWDAIYGYIAIKTDGNTVIGISWYDQKETPGLGANISEPSWQSQFPGKHIFQEGPSGKTDFQDAPIGITVVKGRVNEVFGNSPKALSAVDGMAGATLTGNGVTDAYKNVLSAYRAFLVKSHEENAKNDQNEQEST